MIDRRGFLGGTTATALTAPAAGAGVSNADAALAAQLDAQAAMFLTQWPQEATALGWDVGPHAALRRRLDDRSLAGRAEFTSRVGRALSDLRRIDRNTLSKDGRIDLDISAFVLSTLADTLSRYGAVDIDLRPTPYIVNQMNGAYYWLPDFLSVNHPLETADDLDAWYARLSALAVVIDQETERLRHDAGLGVTPPNFVIQRTVAQIRRLRDASPLASPLLAGAISRARAKGLGDIAPRAEAIFRQEIAPALTRQADALDAYASTASDIAGVWRLPDGDAYYRVATRSNTTTDTSPADLHAAGLEQCRALVAEIDAGLRAQGLSRGPVIERIKALNTDARFLPSDDDAGRARLIDLAKATLSDIVARLPRAFRDPAIDPILVRPTPEAVQANAPAAYYQAGVGADPGLLTLNLGRPQEFATWRLPTIVHHEGMPGHHFQASMLKRSATLPLFRRIVRLSAYTEGYALYAQQLADEIGAFEHDPFGRIGYLQSELFRAARIVVDTGIHHKRWTREQAVAWMVDHAGEDPAATEREVVRYCVYPGQACSFKVGANAIVDIREAARRREGAAFDIRAFHDTLLRSGPLPMSVLARAVA
jgi:uncharacterized protein (DUF885 family)